MLQNQRNTCYEKHRNIYIYIENQINSSSKIKEIQVKKSKKNILFPESELLHSLPDLVDLLDIFDQKRRFVKFKDTLQPKKIDTKKTFEKHCLLQGPLGVPPIPHICHFLYTGKIFQAKILHPKARKLRQIEFRDKIA